MLPRMPQVTTNTASDSETVTVDMMPPEVSISVPEGVQNTAFDVVITFTEVVSGFEQADLMLSGTATTSITVWQGTDDRVWTATLTPTTSGTLTLSIAEGAVIDTAGNTNVLSTAEVSITLNVPDGTASVFVSVCDRTPQVRDAIVAAVSGVSDCADVTAADLAENYETQPWFPEHHRPQSERFQRTHRTGVSRPVEQRFGQIYQRVSLMNSPHWSISS